MTRITTRHPTRLVAALAGLVALSVAGCSSSGSAHDTSASSLKIGVIADESTAVDLSWEISALKAAITRINSAGGIDKHKLSLDFCNELLDPNKARACGNRMVSDKVLMTVGNQPLAAEANVDKILADAKIANVADSSYGPSDSDPNSYMIFGGETYQNASMIAFGVKQFGPKVALSLLDSPVTAGFTPFYKKALPSLHATLIGVATSSQNASDVSPQAAQLVAMKPDWIQTNSSPQAVLGVVKDAAQLGYHGKVLVTGSELTLAGIQSLGSAANDLAFTSPFPPIAAMADFPALQQFHKDMVAEAARGDKAAPTSTVYVPYLAMNAYFGMLAAAKIANSAKATSAAAFKRAIDNAKNVSLGDGLPTWTPNKSISPGVPRASNGYWYFSEWQDGRNVLIDPKPLEVTGVVNAGTGN
jgi:ABC-type branched-subunit amino acid transport system substrate-binding protein